MADDKTLEQNGTTPTNSTCEMLLGGTEFRNVMSISDAPAIKDIFRYKWWTVEEGLFYLTGAFSLVGNTEDSDQDRLITLDGREFRDPPFIRPKAVNGIMFLSWALLMASCRSTRHKTMSTRWPKNAICCTWR